MDDDTARALRTNIAVALATCPKHQLKQLLSKLPIEADAGRAKVAAHIAAQLNGFEIRPRIVPGAAGAPRTPKKSDGSEH